MDDVSLQQPKEEQEFREELGKIQSLGQLKDLLGEISPEELELVLSLDLTEVEPMDDETLKRIEEKLVKWFKEKRKYSPTD